MILNQLINAMDKLPIDILYIILNKLSVNKVSIIMFGETDRSNHILVCNYMNIDTKSKITTDDIFIWAASNGYLNILKWRLDTEQNGQPES